MMIEEPNRIVDCGKFVRLAIKRNDDNLLNHTVQSLTERGHKVIELFLIGSHKMILDPLYLQSRCRLDLLDASPKCCVWSCFIEGDINRFFSKGGNQGVIWEVENVKTK